MERSSPLHPIKYGQPMTRNSVQERMDGTGFLGVIDHLNDEIISWHTAKKGNRFAEMELVSLAVRKQYVSVE